MKIFPMVVALVLLAGCQEKMDACWSPETKQAASSLAKEMILDNVYKSLSAELGNSISQEVKGRIEKNLSVSLKDFYLQSFDKTSGSYKCGAKVSLSYGLTEQKVDADERIIDFDIYRGEASNFYVMNQLVFSQMVADLNNKLNKKSK
jgi:hypothetical protein